MVCPHCDSIIDYSDSVYNCGHCKKPFKGKQEKCPHCEESQKYASEESIRAIHATNLAADNKKAKSAKIGKYAVLGLVGIAIVLMFVVPRTTTTCSDHSDLEAYGYAEDFIKDRLKSPSSAIFPDSREQRSHTNEILSDKKYHIESWVESANGFGVMIRTTFSCDIIFDHKTCKVSAENIRIE